MWWDPSGPLVPTPKLVASEHPSNTAALIGQLPDPPLRKRPPLTMGCGVQLEINDFLVELVASVLTYESLLVILRRSSVDHSVFCLSRWTL
jgi:hypothetical protein